MALKDADIRSLRPRESAYKVGDELGLFLLVLPSGSLLWKMKYRFRGAERKLSLGRYPEVSLRAAREKRDEARRTIASGSDPAALQRAAEIEAAINAATTFRQVAEEYIERMEVEGKAETTITKARWLLRLLDRDIAHRPIAEITPHELLLMLRKVEARGHRETAHRLRAFAGRVFRYAIVTMRAKSNPAELLRGALAAPKVRHHAAILEPKEVGALLRAIDTFNGQLETCIALELAPHVFVRPGELRKAEWTEFDLEASVWKIPGEKMKMDRPHAVPLSRQSLALIRKLRALSNPGRYLFPSIRTRERPMSDGTLNAALRRLGYDRDDMTTHGFRAMASTLLNESGLWHPDAIERALAHQDNDRVRAAYHRGAHWEERVRMMQWWSDQLDTYRKGGQVVPIRRPGTDQLPEGSSAVGAA